MKNQLFFLLIIIPLSIKSQTNSTKNNLQISGYIETYFAFDFGMPASNNRPDFVYSFNRHNEFNINLGLIKAAYQTKKVRSNFTLMAGTYSNANLSSEPGVLKNVYEANVGIKISKTKNLWLDAGIFSSHIGFESAIGKDCWNLTRSILADNSPYYESGVKVSFTSKSEKWFLSALMLNGWQRIQRQSGNSAPAFGHQITFKPNSKLSLNSSSFVGSNTPDSIRKMRYFHNFYSQYQISKKIGILAGFDLGFEQRKKNSTTYNSWLSPVIIIKYSPTQKTNIAARGEYYMDENQVIIQTGTSNGFQTHSYSLNLDYFYAENVLWRIEARAFTSKDEIFQQGNKSSRNNYLLTSSISINF
jgi:hypothetical protein